PSPRRSPRSVLSVGSAGPAAGGEVSVHPAPRPAPSTPRRMTIAVAGGIGLDARHQYLMRHRSAPRSRYSQKRAELVAREIELEILERGWCVGESLGSEPELLARFGVSRSVFREAVRLLEHDDVARMRQGPGGGLVVTEPDAGTVARAAALLLEYDKVAID